MEKLIRSYFNAWEAGSWERLRSLLADDFTFTSPDDDHIRIDEFRQKCWNPMWKNIGVFHLDRIITDKDGGFVRYSNSAPGRKTIRCTEYFAGDNDKITSIDVFWGFKAQVALDTRK